MNERSSPSGSPRQDAIALTALLLFVILRFLPGLVDGLLFSPFRDNVFIYGPMFAETARIALHGQHPFYLPSFSTGFPLFQSPHYSPFYPFYFFGLLDYGGPLHSLYTLTHLSIFHRAILGLNFFVMLRSARVSPWAAFVGASLGVFAYNTEVYSGWITITASYSWFPLMVAGGILLVRDPQRWLGVVLLGGSAGMLTLASASQAVAHALLFSVLFFAAAALWLFRRGGVRLVLQLTFSLVCAALIAFGIGAVSAIPVFLGIGEMVRHISHGYVVGHQAIPWAKFNETQLALKDWPAIFINPGIVEVVGSPYIGPVGLAGVGLLCLFYSKLTSLGKFLAVTVGGIGAYALFSAFGTHLGFSYVNYHLPLINKIREAGRHLVLFVIAVVLLSGLGFDELGRFLRDRKIEQVEHRRSFFVSGIVAFAFAFVALIAFEFAKHAPFARGGAIVLLLAPILAGVTRFRARACYAFVLPAFLVSVASMISPPRMFPVAGSEYSHRDNLRNLETLGVLRDKLPKGDFRIDFVDAKTSPFTWGMNASYFGFDSFYNRLTPQPYQQFWLSVRSTAPHLREMLGARYVLCAGEGKPNDPGATMRFKVNGDTLFENPTYMRRMTIVHSLAGSFSNEAQIIAGLARGFDFRHSVYLQPDDAVRLAGFFPAGPGVSKAQDDEHLSITEESTNRISVALTLFQPGVIVLNEWFTPAWKVRINGLPEKAMRVNQWQVGVPVSAGKSKLEFIYRPTLAWNLLIANRLTWLSLALFILFKIVSVKRLSESSVRIAPRLLE